MSSSVSSLTLMVMRIMSPHWGLPTSPTPSGSSMTPMLRGLRKCSMTSSEYMSVPLLADTAGAPDRRHFTQPRHDRGKHRQEVVYVFGHRASAQSHAQRSMGFFLR